MRNLIKPNPFELTYSSSNSFFPFNFQQHTASAFPIFKIFSSIHHLSCHWMPLKVLLQNLVFSSNINFFFFIYKQNRIFPFLKYLLVYMLYVVQGALKKYFMCITCAFFHQCHLHRSGNTTLLVKMKEYF